MSRDCLETSYNTHTHKHTYTQEDVDMFHECLEDSYPALLSPKRHVLPGESFSTETQGSRTHSPCNLSLLSDPCKSAVPQFVAGMARDKRAIIPGSVGGAPNRGVSGVAACFKTPTVTAAHSHTHTAWAIAPAPPTRGTFETIHNPCQLFGIPDDMKENPSQREHWQKAHGCIGQGHSGERESARVRVADVSHLQRTTQQHTATLCRTLQHDKTPGVVECVEEQESEKAIARQRESTRARERERERERKQILDSRLSLQAACEMDGGGGVGKGGGGGGCHHAQVREVKVGEGRCTQSTTAILSACAGTQIPNSRGVSVSSSMWAERTKVGIGLYFSRGQCGTLFVYALYVRLCF